MTEPEETGISVLIVDDHRVFGESLARLLSDEEGVTVVGVVSDACEAIDLAARLRPRVVLMDYRMPDLDGIALTAEIKGKNPDIMVVMLTGATEDRVLWAPSTPAVRGS